ncbi:DUF5682 family protein [Nakamurella alba]|uniref:DUF5682 family protein n=1 Tax=Nakamurella alba TaxID=2665158 RepID=UPI002AC36B41|nr:DUF5682 family protein [Nakamurella alba]
MTAAAAADRVVVLGIRHHGPGSARSVLAALDELRPSIVLVEGPADAGPLLEWAHSDDMQPPVALFAHAVDRPGHAVFWPFAVFSPEWQAIRWAAEHAVPLRFCDLPAWSVLAGSGVRHVAADARPNASPAARVPDGGDAEGSGAGASGTSGPARRVPVGDAEASGAGASGPARPAERHRPDVSTGSAEASDPNIGAAPDEEIVVADDSRGDPIALLAGAAGYDDPERWWDDVVESRTGGLAAFDALTEAMAELRTVVPPDSPREAAREERREAHMRQAIRTALKDTDGVIAVVCGAWHAPALAGRLPPASADIATLRGLRRRKVALSWVPWTHSRLAGSSGYGAGVTSPGFYHHLFTAPDHPAERWLTAVAGALRGHDMPVSTAHVIEATRLADTLAGLRGRPSPGLLEVRDATLAVLCDADPVAAGFVTSELEVGELLGRVPDDAPAVPLAADLTVTARSLRLKIDPQEKIVDLDLRKPQDRAKSALLHRLLLLGIRWGTPTEPSRQSTGTFGETWSLRWDPELAVAVAEAAGWGSTVPTAAAAKVADTARTSTDLASLTQLCEQVLLADIAEVLPEVLQELDRRATHDTDVGHLLQAVPALVRAVRYGDVRGTATDGLGELARQLVARAIAGFPSAISGLGDTSAVTMRDRLDSWHAAVDLLVRTGRGEPERESWFRMLAEQLDRTDVHGLLAGRIARVLIDRGVVPADEAARRLAARLSVGPTASDKARWIEGFLSGTGLLLVHDRDLLRVLDGWLTALDPLDFLEVLPLLRRTFGEFAAAERENIGAVLADLDSEVRHDAGELPDIGRAAAALRTVALILGGGR